MELARAIRIVITIFRTRTTQLLPFYLLALAVPSIVRVLTFFGIAILAGYLIGAGRIDAFREQLAVTDTDPPDPETDPEAFVEWAEGLQPLIETVVTPTSAGILLITLALTLVGMLILTAAVTAGQFGTCFGLLQGENGIIRGIAGFRQHWVSFVGLFVLELFLWVVVTGVFVSIVAVAALLSLVLALFVGIISFFLWLGIVVAIRALFVFAPVSIVVDGANVSDGLRGSAGFIRAEFANAVIYYVIAVGVILGWGGLSSTLATLGVPSLAAMGSILLVAPALDLLKTILFGDYRDAITPPEAPSERVASQLNGALRRGLSEMGAFVKATPGYHVLAVAIIAAGFGTGWAAIEPFTGELETSITARIAGLIPPTAALEFFGNNWTVAMTLAYSGVAAAIPAITGLWFNGLVFGMYARLEVEPLLLLAFVLPHGIIEIPAIIISGALGLFLGVAVWRAWRGRIDRVALAESLERAVWVLLGIGVLLAIAGAIEGFVSPYYFRLFL